MFLCENCHTKIQEAAKNGDDECFHPFPSMGPCEECGRVAVCVDCAK